MNPAEDVVDDRPATSPSSTAAADELNKEKEDVFPSIGPESPEGGQGWLVALGVCPCRGCFIPRNLAEVRKQATFLTMCSFGLVSPQPWISRHMTWDLYAGQFLGESNYIKCRSGFFKLDLLGCAYPFQLYFKVLYINSNTGFSSILRDLRSATRLSLKHVSCLSRVDDVHDACGFQ